jgi:CheY-like chemotaxis protein
MTFLVVDDEPQQRDIAARMLERLGYVPHAVSSGEEAVAYLQDKKVDLVMLDMIMDPGMNGRCTYEAILERHPGQKAIIASGYSENEEVAKALALGAGRLLKKPYSIHELAMAVKTELIY